MLTSIAILAISVFVLWGFFIYFIRLVNRFMDSQSRFNQRVIDLLEKHTKIMADRAARG